MQYTQKAYTLSRPTMYAYGYSTVYTIVTRPPSDLLTFDVLEERCIYMQ